MGVVIRHATPNELKLIPAIELEAGRIFADIMMSEIADNPSLNYEFLTSFTRHGAVQVAAADSSRLIGFVLTGFLDGAGHVYEMSVLPDQAQQGIGRKLLDAACGYAYAKGSRKMTLSTFRDVPWNGPFYLKSGFTVVDRANWTPALHVLHEREIMSGLDVSRRCFMEKTLS
jgi:ribosomal protein S18 acetylase RimI-like enzyme